MIKSIMKCFNKQIRSWRCYSVKVCYREILAGRKMGEWYPRQPMVWNMFL